ncbi:hypothetical protein KIPB_004887, partial [Kipferlia bialata]
AFAFGTASEVAKASQRLSDLSGDVLSISVSGSADERRTLSHLPIADASVMVAALNDVQADDYRQSVAASMIKTLLHRCQHETIVTATSLAPVFCLPLPLSVVDNVDDAVPVAWVSASSHPLTSSIYGHLCVDMRERGKERERERAKGMGGTENGPLARWAHGQILRSDVWTVASAISAALLPIVQDKGSRKHRGGKRAAERAAAAAAAHASTPQSLPSASTILSSPLSTLAPSGQSASAYRKGFDTIVRRERAALRHQQRQAREVAAIKEWQQSDGCQDALDACADRRRICVGSSNYRPPVKRGMSNQPPLRIDAPPEASAFLAETEADDEEYVADYYSNGRQFADADIDLGHCGPASGLGTRALVHGSGLNLLFSRGPGLIRQSVLGGYALTLSTLWSEVVSSPCPFTALVPDGLPVETASFPPLSPLCVALSNMASQALCLLPERPDTLSLTARACSALSAMPSNIGVYVERVNASAAKLDPTSLPAEALSYVPLSPAQTHLIQFAVSSPATSTAALALSGILPLLSCTSHWVCRESGPPTPPSPAQTADSIAEIGTALTLPLTMLIGVLDKGNRALGGSALRCALRLGLRCPVTDALLSPSCHPLAVLRWVRESNPSGTGCDACSALDAALSIPALQCIDMYPRAQDVRHPKAASLLCYLLGRSLVSQATARDSRVCCLGPAFRALVTLDGQEWGVSPSHLDLPRWSVLQPLLEAAGIDGCALSGRAATLAALNQGAEAEAEAEDVYACLLDVVDACATVPTGEPLATLSQRCHSLSASVSQTSPPTPLSLYAVDVLQGVQAVLSRRQGGEDYGDIARAMQKRGGALCVLAQPGAPHLRLITRQRGKGGMDETGVLFLGVGVSQVDTVQGTGEGVGTYLVSGTMSLTHPPLQPEAVTQTLTQKLQTTAVFYPTLRSVVQQTRLSVTPVQGLPIDLPFYARADALQASLPPTEADREHILGLPTQGHSQADLTPAYALRRLLLTGAQSMAYAAPIAASVPTGTAHSTLCVVRRVAEGVVVGVGGGAEADLSVSDTKEAPAVAPAPKNSGWQNRGGAGCVLRTRGWHQEMSQDAYMKRIMVIKDRYMRGPMPRIGADGPPPAINPFDIQAMTEFQTLHPDLFSDAASVPIPPEDRGNMETHAIRLGMAMALCDRIENNATHRAEMHAIRDRLYEAEGARIGRTEVPVVVVHIRSSREPKLEWLLHMPMHDMQRLGPREQYERLAGHAIQPCLDHLASMRHRPVLVGPVQMTARKLTAHSERGTSLPTDAIPCNCVLRQYGPGELKLGKKSKGQKKRERERRKKQQQGAPSA